MSDQPSDHIAGEALHKFLVMYRHLHRYSRRMNSQGIRPVQLSALLFLQQNGPATIGDVQAYLYSSASMASTLISQLEEAGLVTRTRCQEDNRVVHVAITPAGEKIVATTPPAGMLLLRRRLKDLPEDRLQVIDGVLAELMDLMEITETE